jgi:hypothetical protein
LKFPRGIVKGQFLNSSKFFFNFSRGQNFFFNFRGGRRKVLPVDENFRRGGQQISEGVYRNATTSTGISEGLEKNRKFPKGFY